MVGVTLGRRRGTDSASPRYDLLPHTQGRRRRGMLSFICCCRNKNQPNAIRGGTGSGHGRPGRAPSQHKRPTTTPATARLRSGLPPSPGHPPSHPPTKQQPVIVGAVDLGWRGTTTRQTTTRAAPGRSPPPTYTRWLCTSCSSQTSQCTFLQMTYTAVNLHA
jgi:hypothetical protein